MNSPAWPTGAARATQHVRAMAHRRDPREAALQRETAYGVGNPARAGNFAKET